LLGGGAEKLTVETMEQVEAQAAVVAAVREWVRAVAAGREGDAPSSELAGLSAAVAARRMLADIAEGVIDDAVTAARQRAAGGHTWREIGEAMGVTGQLAGRRAEKRGVDTTRTVTPSAPPALPEAHVREREGVAEPGRLPVPSVAALGLRPMVRRDPAKPGAGQSTRAPVPALPAYVRDETLHFAPRSGLGELVLGGLRTGDDGAAADAGRAVRHPPMADSEIVADV
jgi:hypothetical protein